MRIPLCTATITSGTVDMPTTSAPIIRKKRYSARVSRLGPVTATITPRCTASFLVAISANGNQLRSVGVAHIGKARAEPIIVDAHERIIAHEVDLIVDDHHIAGHVVRIHAADGMGHNHPLGRVDPALIQKDQGSDPHREGTPSLRVRVRFLARTACVMTIASAHEATGVH